MGALFTVRGMQEINAQQVLELQIDALNEQDAREQAQSRGLSVLSVQLARVTKPSTLRAAWRAQDLAWWCRELKSLLGAGMTVVEALETLQAQAGSGSGQSDVHRQQVQDALLLRLRQGQSLSQAMEQMDKFPSVLTASVRAAERTSTLGTALDDYLRYHEVLDQLRRRVLSAAMYPLLVCGIGALICGFLLLVVLPRFTGILAGTTVATRGASGLLIAFSRWLNAHGGLALGLLLAVLIGGFWLWRSGMMRRAFLALALQIPPVAKAVQAFNMAKLYQALALLYRGGYPLEEALDVCRKSAEADGAMLAAQLAISQQALLRGQGVSAALTAGHLTDEVSRRLLSVGERAGGFDAILQVVAQRHAQVFGDFVDRLTRVVEPILLLLVASAVGGVVVLMYLPIFDIATGLQT